MNKTIEHLPKEKRIRLEKAVSVICDMCDDLEMIILFGSHARGDYRDEEDLSPDRKSGAPSDFDLLVICGRKETVNNSQLWYNISQSCNGFDPDTPFRIIEHDIKYVKKRLKEIHFFFSDIVREGCLLYTSGKYQLNVNKILPPEKHTEVAQEHFDHWYKRASNFFSLYTDAFQKNMLCESAFLLHQCAESSYKALLLVFTNYAPHDHYLASADQQIQEVLPELEAIFPRETITDKELFKHFDYAYIGARYDSNYKISAEDLKYLSSRVKVLLGTTEKLCNQEILRLQKLVAIPPENSQAPLP